jgi:RND family efflux transporter MFP subunit
MVHAFVFCSTATRPPRLVWLAPVGARAAACGGQPAAGRTGGGMPPVPVKLAVVQQAPIEDATEYVATLKSLTSTGIQPQVDGQITRIMVKSGDRVNAGAPLVEIDPRRQQAAVSSQEAQRAALEATVAQARADYQRAQTLLQAGAISAQQAEQATTAVETAEATLRAQTAQIEENQVQLHYYTVTAPTAGIVGDVPVRVGNQVTSSTVLTSIDQNAKLEVYVQVPLERVPDLKLGLPLRVLGPDGAVITTAPISFISPRVDDMTQTVLAKAVITNPGSLRSLQLVRAQIVWKTSQGFLIPVLAVIRVNAQYFAFVAESKDGAVVARQRPIQVGPIVGNDYVLLGGIQANDRLVVSGVQKLADGAPIAPQS